MRTDSLQLPVFRWTVKVMPSAMGLVPALIWKVNVVVKWVMSTRLLSKTLPAWPLAAGVRRASVPAKLALPLAWRSPLLAKPAEWSMMGPEPGV